MKRQQYMKSRIQEAMKKKATHPKTEREEDLASLAHPKDKITHKDVLVGRGVLNKEENNLDESMPTPLQVKQGIGIARDKRYAGGNMSGAVRAMRKLHPNLAKHPAVQKELQKQNEEVEQVEQLDELSPKTMASYLSRAGRSAVTSKGLTGVFDDEKYSAMATANKHHPNNMGRSDSEKDSEALKSAVKKMKAADDLSTHYRRKTGNRVKGIARAGRLLAKEEVEELDEVKVGDKVSFSHSVAAAGGRSVEKTGTVHQIDGDTVHVKVKDKYGVITHKKKTNDLMKEEVDSDEKHEMAATQLHFIKYATEEILEYIEMDGNIEEWYQNKLSKVHSDMEGLHSYVEGEMRRLGMKEEIELDEAAGRMQKTILIQAIADAHKKKHGEKMPQHQVDKLFRKSHAELRKAYPSKSTAAPM